MIARIITASINRRKVNRNRWSGKVDSPFLTFRVNEDQGQNNHIASRMIASRLTGLFCHVFTSLAQSDLIQFEKREATFESPIDRTRVGTIWLVSYMGSRSARVQPFTKVRANFE
jgi:hypothetical protein